MHIAILGATSQIAKDLILSFSEHTSDTLELFTRRPEIMNIWLNSVGLSGKYKASLLKDFSFKKHFDAIINFIGVGDPAKAIEMGESIFEITHQYDQLALNYLKHTPSCRYIFMSSGAVYGSNFDLPVDGKSPTILAINSLQPQDWYGVAKMYAECRHRALPHLSIIDIRVFNYFSHTVDLSSRFLIADMLRAIKHDETLITSDINIVRDYIGPDDFFRLISLVLQSQAVNDVIDCYTKSPVDKITLFATMQKYFGLRYAIQNQAVGINATGIKLNYFSQNFKARNFGYEPSLNSLETLEREFKKMPLRGLLSPTNKLNGNHI